MLRSDHTKINTDQIMGLLITLSDTLDVILNPWTDPEAGGRRA